MYFAYFQNLSIKATPNFENMGNVSEFCKHNFIMYMYKGNFAICERYESGPGAVGSS